MTQPIFDEKQRVEIAKEMATFYRSIMNDTSVFPDNRLRAAAQLTELLRTVF